MDDENLFAPHFDNAESWVAWRAFLAVLFGFPLDEQQRELFRQCTGREHINSEGHHEAWLVIGRRGGKSFALALIAVFLACFKDWQQYLGPGERGTIMIVAADRKQARVIMRYCKGLLVSVPMLAQLIQRDRDGVSDISLDLSNRVALEVHTASYRTTRGYTIVAPQAIIDKAYQDDPASASAEYGAQFRSDMESYISRDAIATCVSADVRERPPLPNITYRAFVDPQADARTA